eukprot:gene26726-biopygen17234
MSASALGVQQRDGECATALCWDDEWCATALLQHSVVGME